MQKDKTGEPLCKKGLTFASSLAQHGPGSSVWSNNMSAAVLFKRLETRNQTKGETIMTSQSSIDGGSMGSSSILKGKHAVVFGAGGSIGAAVAKEFAAEGAEVFLAGRTKSTVEEVTTQITASGGHAHAAVIDALEDAAVNEYIGGIVKQTGSIDIVFNAVGPLANEYGNGKNAVDLAIEEFMVPLTTVVKSHFITARAAARHML